MSIINHYSIPIIESAYGSSNNRAVFSHLNDNSTKYVAIMRLLTTMLTIVLDPSDGSLIDARQIDYSQTLTGGSVSACGGISDNMILVSFLGISSENFHFVDFINIDTWSTNSYVSSTQLSMLGFSSLFNTDQILLLYQNNDPSEYFSIKTAYDRLDLVESFAK